jgi:hypothetical protein
VKGRRPGSAKAEARFPSPALVDHVDPFAKSVFFIDPIDGGYVSAIASRLPGGVAAPLAQDSMETGSGL